VDAIAAAPSSPLRIVAGDTFRNHTHGQRSVDWAFIYEDFMAHRADLNSLTAAQRTQLVNLMLNYLTDPVVADHVNIIHSGLELFTGHRAYILGMENYLAANGGAAFVPLPFWNPATPIPAEFNVVKNQGPARPPLVNLNPNVPKPPQFEYPRSAVTIPRS
jgi:hypothetical protein